MSDGIIGMKNGKHFHFDNLFLNCPVKCGFIDLYQIGELCCESGYVIEEHMQTLCEITYVISGSGRAFVDGEPVPLTAGDAMINSVGHRHKIEAGKNSFLRFAYIGFLFNGNAAKKKYRDLTEIYNSSPFKNLKADSTVYYPFIRLVDEFYRGGLCSDKITECYCEQIIIHTARLFFDNPEKALPQRRIDRKSTCPAVYSVIRYVEENIENIESIHEIAAYAGYSYTYLSHLFKNKTGIILSEYIRYKKIERAASLIRDGGMSPTQAGEILRYESLASFSKSFKSVMGISPRKYAADCKK